MESQKADGLKLEAVQFLPPSYPHLIMITICKLSRRVGHHGFLLAQAAYCGDRKGAGKGFDIDRDLSMTLKS
jgi:hypothetical protein